MSEDGSSSSSGGRPPSGSAAAATTPSKKLNPKAAPYNPNPAMLSQAGKAAAAQQGNAYQQQQAQPYHQQAGMFGGGAYGNVSSPAHGDYGSASAAFGGLPARGPSPVGGAGGLLGDLPISSGLLLSSHGSYGAGNDAGMDPASLHYQQQQQQGGLLSYRSADQGLLGGPGFDQGLTSPNHHHFQQLDGMGPALSPQQQQQQYGLPMHQQQQLLELLSAAGPGEAARYGSIGSAGGSAPLSLNHGHGSSMDAYVAAELAAASLRNSYSSVPEHHLHHAAAAAAAANGGMQRFATRGGRGVPPGFDSMYGNQQQQGRSRGLTLNIDDDQLPPGFSAEDYTTTPPSSSTSAAAAAGMGVPGAFLQPATTVGMPAVSAAGAGTPSPSSIPTTAGLGVFGGSSSVWAPLAATAGSAASSVAASMRALWPSPLTSSSHPNLSAAAAAAFGGSGSAAGGGSSSVHSYSRSQELEVEVAAATTSANVAELVLGTSPMSAPGAVDAQMSKLAKEMMAGLID